MRSLISIFKLNARFYRVYIYVDIYNLNSTTARMNRRRNVNLSLEIPETKMAYEGPKPPADEIPFLSMERKEKEDFSVQIDTPLTDDGKGEDVTGRTADEFLGKGWKDPEGVRSSIHYLSNPYKVGEYNHLDGYLTPRQERLSSIIHRLDDFTRNVDSQLKEFRKQLCEFGNGPL